MMRLGRTGTWRKSSVTNSETDRQLFVSLRNESEETYDSLILKLDSSSPPTDETRYNRAENRLSTPKFLRGELNVIDVQYPCWNFDSPRTLERVDQELLIITTRRKNSRCSKFYSPPSVEISLRDYARLRIEKRTLSPGILPSFTFAVDRSIFLPASARFRCTYVRWHVSWSISVHARRCGSDDCWCRELSASFRGHARPWGGGRVSSREPRALIRATIPRELIAGRTFNRLEVSRMRSRAKLGAVYRPDRK